MTLFTFHYASTLSYTIIWNSLALTIYIPLCFYFIRRWDWYRGLVLYNLHSTMLLLYPGGQGSAATVTVFTFHYASTLSITDKHYYININIYIPLCFYFIYDAGITPYCTAWFTFHYASTLSEFLFVLSVFCCIYIPLCFYFIDMTSLPISLKILFTFHYASTLSNRIE